MLDALPELVPQISYLSRLSRPLQRLSGLLEACGGVWHATYGEARDLVPALAARLREPAAAPTLVDAETRDTLAAWSAVRDDRAAVEAAGNATAPRYRAVPVVDMLVRGGECAVLAQHTVYRLSAVAAALLHLSADAVDEGFLVRALVDLYGAPAGSDGSTEVGAAIAALIDAGLLEHVGEGDAAEPHPEPADESV